jgi:hypothetical protein
LFVELKARKNFVNVLQIENIMSEPGGDVIMLVFLCFMGMMAVSIMFASPNRGDSADTSETFEPQQERPVPVQTVVEASSAVPEPLREPWGFLKPETQDHGFGPDIDRYRVISASDMSGISVSSAGATSLAEAFPDPLRH